MFPACAKRWQTLVQTSFHCNGHSSLTIALHKGITYIFQWIWYLLCDLTGTSVPCGWRWESATETASSQIHECTQLFNILSLWRDGQCMVVGSTVYGFRTDQKLYSHASTTFDAFRGFLFFLVLVPTFCTLARCAWIASFAQTSKRDAIRHNPRFFLCVYIIYVQYYIKICI